MPQQLALLIYILIILYLFWMDRKKIEGVSKAIWIPFIWMLLAGSRYVSQWLNIGAPIESADAYFEGSPVDRAVFFMLIVAGIIILVRRRLDWGNLLVRNKWIWLYFLFGAISIFWSDYSFVSFKRWFKSLGSVIMVLVILTEQRPYEALGTILRRLAFLFLPLSILFLKYYPALGRASGTRGLQMPTGVAGGKNGLGVICMISGIYFFWNLLFAHRKGIEITKRLHYSIYLIILPMIVWLFYRANSATSLACMIVAICLFMVSQQLAMVRNPRRIWVIGLVCIAIYGVLELLFDLTLGLITMLGRDETLTTRVPMWKELLSMVRDPILGFGYGSFWIGERQELVSSHWGTDRQAHNGYLEMYLNLGLFGLFFILSWILSGLKKVAHELVVDYHRAILKLCFIVVIILFNWTEAGFGGVSNIWVLFLFAVMDYDAGKKSVN